MKLDQQYFLLWIYTKPIYYILEKKKLYWISAEIIQNVPQLQFWNTQWFSSNSSNNCIRTSEDYHLTCLWLSGFHVSSRLRTISSLTRKLSLSNSRILINGGDRDRDRDSPQQCGEYLHSIHADYCTIMKHENAYIIWIMILITPSAPDISYHQAIKLFNQLVIGIKAPSDRQCRHVIWSFFVFRTWHSFVINNHSTNQSIFNQKQVCL